MSTSDSQIELHPPRGPKAEAREWALEVLATPVDPRAATEQVPILLVLVAVLVILLITG